MKLLSILMVVALLLITVISPADAQDCGAGLPCGPLPWRLPSLPNLQSPTPIGNYAITATPTGTVIAPPTPTSDLGMQELRDQVGTLQALMDATHEAVATVDGGGFNPDNAGETLPLFFRFSYWVHSFRFGIFTPLISAFVFAFVSLLLLALGNVILPLIAPLIGLIRIGVEFVLQVIQFIAKLVHIVVQFIRG